MDVRAALSLVDGRLVGIRGKVFVDDGARVIDVAEVLQSPLEEGLTASDEGGFSSGTLEINYKRMAFVVVEVALLKILQIF